MLCDYILILKKNMAEDICFFHKDTLIIKAPKKSPLILRLVVLFFAMVCGVHICLMCIKQTTNHTNNKFLNFTMIERVCKNASLEPWEAPFLHYPKPKTFSRGECACNPVRYFAILTMQRTGSGWFETLLNNHTNVSSFGELFSVQERRTNVSMILKTMDRAYNLDWLNSATKNECSAAVGFKWMLNQGLMQHPKEIVEYFKKNRISAVFLFRRNPLRRMISVLANIYDKDAKLLNGTHKSHVHSPLEAEILAQYKPEINAVKLIPELKQVMMTRVKALEYFKSIRHIVIYYEDLVKNCTKLADVQEFLRLPYRDLHSRQVKIHLGPLSSHVSNWGEIQRVLNGTEYERFLHSDYEV